VPLYRRDQGLKRAAARGGFVLRRVASGGPPVIEPAIVSIDGDGQFATLAVAPAAPEPLEPIVVRRSGYKMDAGDPSPSLVNWNETVWLTKRRVTPGGPEANGYVGTDTAMSRVIMAGDAFPNQVGAVNNSTRTPPRINVRWISPAYRVVGNAISAILTCNSFYTRGGSPVAAMAVVYRDTVGGVVRAFQRTPVPWTGHGVTGNAAHAWRFDDVDITALAEGQITQDWEVYGHYGQLVASNDAAFDVANTRRWFHGRRYFAKNLTKAATPRFAYIKLGTGTTGTTSTNPATARANPYPSWTAARNAIQALGSHGNNLDGAIFRIMPAVDGDTLIGSLSNSGSCACQFAGFIVEPDPDAIWGAGGPTLQNWSTGIANSTGNLNGHIGFTVRGFNYRRNSTNFINNPAAINAQVYIEAPAGGGTFDFNGSTAAVLANSGMAHLYGYTIPQLEGTLGWTTGLGVSGYYDVAITNGGGFELLSPTYVCLSTRSVSAINPNGNSDAWWSLFLDGVRMEQGTSTTTSIFSAVGFNSQHVSSRNSEFIPLNSSEQNRLILMHDNQSNSAVDVYFHHCTVVGLCASTRGNSFYTDGAGPPQSARVHRYAGFTNCVLPAIPSKGDWFGNGTTPDAAREPGWREFGYGIGLKGNYHTIRWGLSIDDNEAVRFRGLNAVGELGAGRTTRGNGAHINPGFLDPRVPTVVGGAAGTVGGDYRHTYTMPVASDADVRFDIKGLPVPLACVRPGAHSGYGL
jgi:hypothetical protein